MIIKKKKKSKKQKVASNNGLKYLVLAAVYLFGESRVGVWVLA